MFASIQAPRNGGNTRHHFGEILFIAFAALLCGVRTYELMEGFAELREDWLRNCSSSPMASRATTPCDLSRGYNQTRARTSAANHPILRRMALNAHNRMPGTGKRRNSLPKREMRAVLDPAYLEPLLSLV